MLIFVVQKIQIRYDELKPQKAVVVGRIHDGHGGLRL